MTDILTVDRLQLVLLILNKVGVCIIMESKTVDIVYPLAEGLSHFRNQELKYSLRSVEKYVTGFRNIYLIGFKPPFINDKIIHVMQEDHPYHCKERRIMEKFFSRVRYRN
jgi:hypothetical protein